MSETINKKYIDIISDHFSTLSKEWLKLLETALEYQKDLLTEKELLENINKFLTLFKDALKENATKAFSGPNWENLRQLISQIIQKWASEGFTIRETLSFITTFQKVLFLTLENNLSETEKKDFKNFADLNNIITEITNYTAEQHVKNRELIISRQQHEILELSTPVIRLWEGILAIPLIGTLDSARTQMVMETLLQKIVETGSELAIIDITGVPAVDTQVAQHIIKTIDAARLMGADCIISGIRPQIAQTMVALGVSFEVITKATLADAFQIALKRIGFNINKNQSQTS